MVKSYYTNHSDICVDYSDNIPHNQEKIVVEGMDLISTLLRKNTDYGSSAFDPPLLAPNISGRDGILTRMSDKVKRIAQLRKTGTAQVAESLEDSIRDLAGYCILYLVCPEEENPADE